MEVMKLDMERGTMRDTMTRNQRISPKLRQIPKMMTRAAKSRTNLTAVTKAKTQTLRTPRMMKVIVSPIRLRPPKAIKRLKLRTIKARSWEKLKIQPPKDPRTRYVTSRLDYMQ
jgi:hypothetical protein